MFAQTSTASCPLCKHPSDANAKLNGYPTRLCEKCRSLIETIFPQNIARNGASLNAPLLPVQELVETPVLEPPTFSNQDLLKAPESPVLIEPSFSEPAEKPAVDEPTFVEVQNDFAISSSLPDGGFYFQDMNAPQEFTEAHKLPQQVDATPQFHEPEPAAQPLPISDSAPLPVYETAPVNGNNAYQSAPSTMQEFPAEQNGKFVTGSIIDDTPRWNTQMDDFPYLVQNPQGNRLSSKLLLALGGIGLLAVLAAGYLFVYKPYFAAAKNSAQKPAANTPQVTQTPSPASAAENSTAANAAALTDTNPQQATASKPEEPKKAETMPTPEVSGQGQFALQAGVFSSEANAGEFAERLKKAGVPAYTAAAKANKFRVLVGKFVSASDAQKFIAQAQARANSAGIKLELLVSEMNP
ncbi:MAG: SPOR domain-containing protein [Acidobacteriota bacterium]